MFFEERDSFTASPTRDGVCSSVVETPGYLGAAFESQADSALECLETEPGERISCNTVKRRRATKILAHATVRLDWYWQKK